MGEEQLNRGEAAVDGQASGVVVVPRQQLQDALNYIKHCGSNAIMRGQPHPQQQIVDDLERALASGETGSQSSPHRSSHGQTTATGQAETPPTRPVRVLDQNADGQEQVSASQSSAPGVEPVPSAPEPLPERVRQEIERRRFLSRFGEVGWWLDDMYAIARLAIACERERTLRVAEAVRNGCILHLEMLEYISAPNEIRALDLARIVKETE